MTQSRDEPTLSRNAGWRTEATGPAGGLYVRGRSMRGEAFTPVPNRGMITISIMLANIMQGVDNTILNVALPHIQGSLSGLARSDRLDANLLYRLRRDHDAVDRLARRPIRHQIHIPCLHHGISPLPRRCAAQRRASASWCCSAPCRASPAPGSFRCRRRYCCRSTRRSGTAKRWRCSAPARFAGQSWGRRSAAG